MAAPLNTCTTTEERGVVRFLWEKDIAAKDTTEKCCPCTVNIACHVKQSSKTTSFGGTLSWRWSGGKRSVRGVPTATTKILRRRFPGTCEMMGQVFKFVGRLRLKINAVCMSLSTFVSFHSRFVTYLLQVRGRDLVYKYGVSGWNGVGTSLCPLGEFICWSVGPRGWFLRHGGQVSEVVGLKWPLYVCCCGGSTPVLGDQMGAWLCWQCSCSSVGVSIYIFI